MSVSEPRPVPGQTPARGQASGSVKPPVFSTGLRTMPDFVTGTHAFRHTLFSSLASLSASRVAPGRISLLSAGACGLPTGSVVAQQPMPGAPLDRSDAITLWISGSGFYHQLPFGMRDTGGEREPGTREMFEGLDDPLLKLTHWFREGALLFRIAPDDPAACARWLALFGIQAEEWPSALHYPLASLIGSFAALAGTQQGIALVLDVLFGLPVADFSYRRATTPLPEELLTKLGTPGSRLGVSMILGDRMEDLAALAITLGPLTLAQYERFAEGAERQLLRRALEFLIPVSVEYLLCWQVLDARQAPRLGLADRNSRLGVNCHLGSS